MRIPDPYFSFGRKTTSISAAPDAPGPVYPNGRGDQLIANAGERIGESLFRIGAEEREYKGRMELAAANEQKQEAERLRREQEAEAKRLERVKQHGEAQTSLFQHENAMSELATAILEDRTTTPTEKLQKFDEAAKEIRGSFSGKVPEEYRYAFEPAFEQQHLKLRHGLVTGMEKQEKEVVRGQLVDAVEALKRTSQPLSVKLTLVNELEWEKAGYGPDEQAKQVQAFRESVTADAVAERFNTVGPKATLAELTAKQGEDGPYSNFQYLEPKTRESLVQAARHQIDQQNKEAERERKERERQRKDDARDAYDLYKEAKEGLLPLSVKDEAALLRRMSGTDYLKRARAVHSKTTSIGFELEKIKSDPLTFGAARLGLAVQPLDTRDVTAWPQQLQQRGQIAGAIKGKYGLSYLPILTNQEAKGLADIMQTQSGPGIVRTFEAFNQIPGMKGATIKQMASQIAQVDNGLGMVVGLTASGKSDAALHVANGLKIVKDKGLPTTGNKNFKTDMEARFSSLLGDAVSHNPQQREAIGNAVDAAYVSLSAQSGKLDGTLDKSLYDKAFSLVAGEPVKINGKRVLTPSRVPESAFKDFFKRTSSATVEAAGGVRGYKDNGEAARAIRNSGQLYEMGEGRYRVAIDGRYLQTTDGRDFILSIGMHQ